MAERPEYNDLCTTCIHAPTCSRRVYARAPIWFCDEFDDRDPSLEQDGADAESPRVAVDNPREQPEQGASPPGNFNGLCATCENRFTCKLPRPEGGVWHCEEYV